MLKQLKEYAILLENQQLSDDLWLATFKAPLISQCAQPGQFVLIEPSKQFFLKRPFSFFDINQTEKTFQIYYQCKGLGTWYMANQWQPGQIIEIQGPHGQGFDITNQNDILIVAGGIGIAPMKCLIDQLEKDQKEYQVIFGAQSEKALKIVSYFSQQKSFLLVTDDGTLGKQQNVILALRKYLEKHIPKLIIGCGPEIVLTKIRDIAYQYNIPTQLSYESHMACGVGACMGCTKIKNNISYKICTDGPVIIENNSKIVGE